MKDTQMLKGKHALIFGAGGSFGSVVAREFAAEGAEVFLSGRSRTNVEEAARQITADGGAAAHTGGRCVAAAGHLSDGDVSVQANMMERETVWPAMLEAFRTATGAPRRCSCACSCSAMAAGSSTPSSMK